MTTRSSRPRNPTPKHNRLLILLLLLQCLRTPRPRSTLTQSALAKSTTRRFIQVIHSTLLDDFRGISDRVAFKRL